MCVNRTCRGPSPYRGTSARLSFLSCRQKFSVTRGIQPPRSRTTRARQRLRREKAVRKTWFFHIELTIIFSHNRDDRRIYIHEITFYPRRQTHPESDESVQDVDFIPERGIPDAEDAGIAHGGPRFNLLSNSKNVSVQKFAVTAVRVHVRKVPLHPCRPFTFAAAKQGKNGIRRAAVKENNF